MSMTEDHFTPGFGIGIPTNAQPDYFGLDGLGAL